MNAYLGIENLLFQPQPVSGIPFPSPFFLTRITQSCLRGGSASTYVVVDDHSFIYIYIYIYLFISLFICLFTFPFNFYFFVFPPPEVRQENGLCPSCSSYPYKKTGVLVIVSKMIIVINDIIIIIITKYIRIVLLELNNL